MVYIEQSSGRRVVMLAEETLQERILHLATNRETTQYALIKRVADLDAVEGWTGQGVSTCANWVARAAGIDASTAREWVRVARALSDLPYIDATFEAGLSYAKVRTLTRVATRENEQALLELAWDTPASRLGEVLARWLEHDTSEDDASEAGACESGASTDRRGPAPTDSPRLRRFAAAP
jgi:hypothetical protein